MYWYYNKWCINIIIDTNKLVLFAVIFIILFDFILYVNADVREHSKHNYLNDVSWKFFFIVQTKNSNFILDSYNFNYRQYCKGGH